MKYEGRPKYLVTADIAVLVRRWAEQNRFHAPSREFFSGLQQELMVALSEIFEPRGIQPDLLNWTDMKSRLMSLIEEEARGLPVISLDSVYVENADMRFSVTRLNALKDGTWIDLGHGPRPNAGMVDTQLTRIVQSSALEGLNDRRVVVVDDGVWSGSTFYALQELLKERGIEVAKFLVGVYRKSEDPAGQEYLQKLDAKVIPTEEGDYKPGEIFEWVCMRDFFPGVPFSGRTVGSLGETANGIELAAVAQFYPSQPVFGNIGAPYVLTLGNPVDWACIPAEHAKAFSLKCLELTRRLFVAIEEETSRVLGYHRPVQVKDLDRVPFRYLHRDWPVIRELDKTIEMVDRMY